MSDWTEQIAELQRSWVEQQQQLTKEWLDSFKGMGDASLRAHWRKATDLLEEQARTALDTQTRSLMACVANLEKLEGLPDEAREALAQTRASIESWFRVQGDIWKAWFETLRDSAPAPQTPAEAMMERWEELAKKTMSIQEKWLAK